MVKPIKPFRVYKRADGTWKFWMNARGKSAKQLRHSLWWLNKGEIRKSCIFVENDEEKAGVKW